MPEPQTPNADQAAYWNDAPGARWARLHRQTDASFSALTQAALDFAAPAAGERVLDIGCGAGETSLQLAHRVGPSGHVHGVDISAVMLDSARARLAEDSAANIGFTLADAASADLPNVDLVFSRFGVMFFDAPVGALANLRRALAPGGRIAFICWRRMPDSSWFLVPWVAVKPLLPPQPKPDPTAPGPFAFADPERLRGLLAEAGFSDIRIQASDTPMGLGTLDDAVSLITQIGPVSRALGELAPDQRPAAVAAVRAALAGHVKDGMVWLEAACWQVGAKA